MKKKFTIDIYLNDTQISLLTKYNWEKGVKYIDLECEEDGETLIELERIEIIYYNNYGHKYSLSNYGEKIFQQLNK